MTTFRELQDEILLALHGFGLAQPRATFLTAAATATDLTLSVRSGADLEMGLAEIGGELVFIESVDRAANTVTVAPDGRGYYGTTAAAHAIDTRLTFSPTWPRQRVKAAINDTILSLWPDLWGVAQTQFTYTPAVTTYELPAVAEGVLAVTADTLGPSEQQQIIKRYSFDSSAPTDDWATTNTITLGEAPYAGSTVTVTYRKQPTILTNDDDGLLAVSGLRESSRQLLMLGATANLLSAMDASRLAVDTSTADEVDERNQPGTAARLANQFQIRFELEVAKEQRRLRATTPATINVRYR